MLYDNFSFPPRVQTSPHLLQWFLKKDGNTFRLSLGGYPYTGVIDGKVTASIDDKVNAEWIATYRERQDAYT